MIPTNRNRTSKLGDLVEISIDEIQVSPQNVRTKRRSAAIEDLKLSIKRIGLIEPVIAFRSNGGYELIVGQRRLLAYQELRKEDSRKYSRIKTIVINRPTDREARLMSLVENLQRTDLTASEKTRACTELLNELGTVRAVSEALGWHPLTVTRWLEFGELVPSELQELVDERKMSREDAKKISGSTYPDLGRAVEIGRAMVAKKLSAPVKERLFEIARTKRKLSVSDVVKEAKKPKETLTVTFYLIGTYKTGLEKATRDRRDSDINVAAQRIVQDWLDERGYTGK